MLRVYRSTSEASEQRARRLRGPARARGPALRGRRAALALVRDALPRVHRRRVPGRQPPPADAARAVARRARRPLRRRRRLPVDLRVHRRVARASALDAARFPHATVIRLEENYRSSPQVLELANRLVPKLGGAEKTLRATRADGPEPELHSRAETKLPSRSNGFARSTFRTRTSRSSAARTRGSSTSRRRCTRQASRPGCVVPRPRERALRAAQALRRRRHVRRLAEERGWLEFPPDKLGERELVRQTDLGRLVKLADELAASSTAPASSPNSSERFGDRGEARAAFTC